MNPKRHARSDLLMPSPSRTSLVGRVVREGMVRVDRSIAAACLVR